MALPPSSNEAWFSANTTWPDGAIEFAYAINLVFGKAMRAVPDKTLLDNLRMAIHGRAQIDYVIDRVLSGTDPTVQILSIFGLSELINAEALSELFRQAQAFNIASSKPTSLDYANAADFRDFAALLRGSSTTAELNGIERKFISSLLKTALDTIQDNPSHLIQVEDAHTAALLSLKSDLSGYILDEYDTYTTNSPLSSSVLQTIPAGTSSKYDPVSLANQLRVISAIRELSGYTLADNHLNLYLALSKYVSDVYTTPGEPVSYLSNFLTLNRDKYWYNVDNYNISAVKSETSALTTVFDTLRFYLGKESVAVNMPYSNHYAAFELVGTEIKGYSFDSVYIESFLSRYSGDKDLGGFFADTKVFAELTLAALHVAQSNPSHVAKLLETLSFNMVSAIYSDLATLDQYYETKHRALVSVASDKPQYHKIRQLIAEYFHRAYASGKAVLQYIPEDTGVNKTHLFNQQLAYSRVSAKDLLPGVALNKVYGFVDDAALLRVSDDEFIIVDIDTVNLAFGAVLRQTADKEIPGVDNLNITPKKSEASFIDYVSSKDQDIPNAKKVFTRQMLLNYLADKVIANTPALKSKEYSSQLVSVKVKNPLSGYDVSKPEVSTDVSNFNSLAAVSIPVGSDTWTIGVDFAVEILKASYDAAIPGGLSVMDLPQYTSLQQSVLYKQPIAEFKFKEEDLDAAFCRDQFSRFFWSALESKLGVERIKAKSTNLRLGLEQVHTQATEILRAVYIKQAATTIVQLGRETTDTAAAIERLSEELNRVFKGAAMATLVGELNKLISSVERFTVTRTDKQTVLENLVVFVDDTPIVEPVEPVPVAVILNAPSVAVNTSTMTLYIAGSFTVAYRYRLNGGAWSAEAPISTALYLSNMIVGPNTLEVIGKNSQDVWQDTLTPTTQVITIDLVAGTPWEPPEDGDGAFDPQDPSVPAPPGAATMGPGGNQGLGSDFGNYPVTPLLVPLTGVLDPDKIVSYSISLSMIGGTFDYGGLITTVPEVKAILDIQGLRGLVERVGPDSNRSNPGTYVEGRITSAFDNELVYINLPEKKKGNCTVETESSYKLQDALTEIEEQAGINPVIVTVDSPDNIFFREYEHTGRFTEALQDMAEIACGELLLRGDTWFIIPRGTTMGSYPTVPFDRVININQRSKTDAFDEIYALINDRKNLKIELANLEDKKNKKGGPKPLGNISFSFGTVQGDRKDWQPVPGHIWIRSRGYVDEWDVRNYPKGFNEGTIPSKYYYQARFETDDDGVMVPNTTIKEGFYWVEMAEFWVPIDYPEDDVDRSQPNIIYAKGKLKNMDFWGPETILFEERWSPCGDFSLDSKTFYTPVPPGNSLIRENKYWMKFSTKTGGMPNVDNEVGGTVPKTGENAYLDFYHYVVDIELQYMSKSGSWTCDDVARHRDILRKIACIDSTLEYYGLSSDVMELINESNELWVEYEQAKDEGRRDDDWNANGVYNKGLDTLFAEAVAKDLEIVNLLNNSVKPTVLETKVSFIYTGSLPLPAHAATVFNVNEEEVNIPGIDTVLDLGRVESVSLSGYTVNMTTSKVVTN